MGKGLSERRRDRRYEFHSGFRAARVCGGSVQTPGPTECVRGEIQNASAGGVCVVTEQCLKEFELIRAEIAVNNLPVSVPTLMQVRWVSCMKNTRGHRMGLQFLI